MNRHNTLNMVKGNCNAIYLNYVIKVGMNNTLFKNAPAPYIDLSSIVYIVLVIGITAIILWIVWSYVKEWLRSQLQEAVAAPSKTNPEEFIRGQWCFVGEDLTGRWCVKTPEEGLCPTKRVFQSRSECERKTASASPLGINQTHDTTMIPIAGLSIA